MRILIAEDDTASRLLLKKLVERMGYEVIEAADGEEAWRAYLRGDTPLVLLDWMMPKMDGIELCRKIRAYEQTHKHSDYTYIIMVTAKTATKDLVEGMEAGADDFVAKPYVPSVLAVRTKAGERLLSAKEEVKKYALALEEERDNLEKKVEERTKELRESLREKEELMREVHHRVKNNLQIISSLLDMQAARIKDKKVVDALSDSRSRIQTMSLIHTQLYQSENLELVEMGVTIRKLVDLLLQIYAKERRDITTVVTAKDVVLPISQAIPCALIINELVSNAFKHAFRGMTKGSIEISMHELAGDKIELTVKDNGVGIPEEFDIYKTKTLGLRLVRALAEDQLKGKMKLNRDVGTEFCIEFKNKYVDTDDKN
ncbi:MAG: sensor histidine kinase [Candidatus Methanospirareceae archaeon]